MSCRRSAWRYRRQPGASRVLRAGEGNQEALVPWLGAQVEGGSGEAGSASKGARILQGLYHMRWQSFQPDAANTPATIPGDRHGALAGEAHGPPMVSHLDALRVELDTQHPTADAADDAPGTHAVTAAAFAVGRIPPDSMSAAHPFSRSDRQHCKRIANGRAASQGSAGDCPHSRCGQVAPCIPRARARVAGKLWRGFRI